MPQWVVVDVGTQQGRTARRPTDAETVAALLRPGSARWRWSRRSPTRISSASTPPLMSPLVWDLGHIAAFEDLWIVHRYGGRPLLREGLAEVYDAFETPRAERGDCRSCARRGPRVPGRGPRPHARGDRGARDRGRRRSPSSSSAMSSSTTRRCSRRSSWRASTATAPRPRAATAPRRRLGDRGRRRPGADRDPGRAVHDRRPRRGLCLRQRAPAPPHRRARLSDRSHADHQRDAT